MFILEEPCTSNLLLETLEKNQFNVLNNDFVKHIDNNYKLKLLCDEEAIEILAQEKDPLIYSNSENSINWIVENLKHSSLSEYIKLFKDKAKFRELLVSIYPDFFFAEYETEELDKIDINEIPKPFIIKPTIGFLSLGVYTVKTNQEWDLVLKSIKIDVKNFADMFPSNVVNSSKFIIEEFIEGEEFAIDAYFSKEGKPVILGIFSHPFISKEDVSDRVYLTSKEIIEQNLDQFQELLVKIGELANLKNFPMHMEVRVSKSGKILPIEINPMRFAGWCTTDISYFAYGINVYESYFHQLQPNWDNILKDKEGEIYYFAMAEVSTNIKASKIKSFNYEKFLNTFSNILEVRKFNHNQYPLFAIVFAQTEDYEEINKILSLEMRDFIKIK